MTVKERLKYSTMLLLQLSVSFNPVTLFRWCHKRAQDLVFKFSNGLPLLSKTEYDYFILINILTVNLVADHNTLLLHVCDIKRGLLVLLLNTHLIINFCIVDCIYFIVIQTNSSSVVSIGIDQKLFEIRKSFNIPSYLARNNFSDVCNLLTSGHNVLCIDFFFLLEYFLLSIGYFNSKYLSIKYFDHKKIYFSKQQLYLNINICTDLNLREFLNRIVSHIIIVLKALSVHDIRNEMV
ncbi:hypothetical protein AGLY_008994 [Aphis glycines]|uniref:Uncharacterized protein n=1 Tax=Aphis glycines TaxID=307491 RepID=A0A6G0TKK1_APHGL|nr:hypothetical protein AGLY_008994 [Aphis glycines]